jgi:hypothetical protein
MSCHRKLLRVVSFTLHSSDGKKLRGKIFIDRAMISIGFAGYGEKAALRGKGTPILIEYRDDATVHVPSELAPVIHVFGDITSDNTTDNISLAGAAEKKREE